MNIHEAAAKLNGNEYREEGSKELFAAMKAARLVAVYGASDDLVEFSGAIDDEVGSYQGTIAYLTSDGLLENDCDNDRCPHFNKVKENAAQIKAIWDDGGFSWRYETEIPHAKFIINEDGEPYCEGIVFSLDAVKRAQT